MVDVMRSVISLFGIALFAYSAQAAQVRVELAAFGAAGECLANARVVITQDGGKRTEVVPVDHTATVSLTKDGPWKIFAEANGCWSETHPWPVAGSTRLQLRMFRAAILEGVMEGGKGPMPAGIRAWVYPAGVERSIETASPDLPGYETHCASSEWRWRCTIPADVPFDLRLDVPGFASLHYWDIRADAGEVREVESQSLRAGASLSGWVQTQEETPISSARVTVFPLSQLTAGTRETKPTQLRTARTNRRGFFQIDGLDPGHYRLVSESSGVSPVVLPEVDVRAGAGVTLPRPLRHAPHGSAEVVIDPPTDWKRRQWSVEIAEAAPLYPGRRPSRLVRTANADGHLLVGGLRAGAYDVSVRDSSGSVVRRAELDLSGGGRRTVRLSVHAVIIRGVIKAGSDAVQADLELSSGSRDYVKVSSDKEGRFEVAVPRAGKWSAVVLYPPDERPARIQAPPIEIPDDTPAGSSYDVIVELPGGRLYGEVVEGDGRRTTAVVYVRQKGRMKAQQRTGSDGKFDLIGVAPGTYHVEAQTAEGGTSQPLEVAIEEGESRQLEIVTEPYAVFSGQILTPDGRPASGAVIMYSQNGGASWVDITADRHGRFEQRINRAFQTAPMIVLTHEYPATMLAAPIGEPVRIQLRSDGGIIRFDRSRAFLFARGIRAPAAFFNLPKPAGRFGGGVYVETGVYTVCPELDPTHGCQSVTVDPGSEQTVRFEK